MKEKIKKGLLMVLLVFSLAVFFAACDALFLF